MEKQGCRDVDYASLATIFALMDKPKAVAAIEGLVRDGKDVGAGLRASEVIAILQSWGLPVTLITGPLPAVESLLEFAWNSGWPVLARLALSVDYSTPVWGIVQADGRGNVGIFGVVRSDVRLPQSDRLQDLYAGEAVIIPQVPPPELPF
jgi:hypothetical protein